ncbi:MAG: hypothetical protein AAGA09_03620 [Pseudomonadota bacterium]
MTIPTVSCGTHGVQPQTFVCVHIVAALKNGEPCGFWWSRSEDGVWDAVCNLCNDLDQAAFDALGAGNISAICLGCFEDAAALNEVELD